MLILAAFYLSALPDITWAFKAKYVKQCEHFNLEARKVGIIPNLLCAAAKFEMT